ncbi:MAG TPA: RDD family protein [Bacteroidetes bacterium]|nr:RDD family protein [Bacteroidota bacterium]
MTIDIRTAQNVTIEYELASLRERFFGFFIDLLIYFAIYLFLVFFIASIFGDFITDWGFRFIAIMHVAGLMLYHFLSEIFANGQSWGKRAVKLKVVRLDGQEPSPGDYLMRSLFLLLDFIFSAGVLGAVLISSTFRGQRLGDLAANTVVIRVKNKLHFELEDILSIQSLEDYEPQYPEVKQLTEQDMLLIKNTLSRNQSWRNPAHAKAINDASTVISTQLNITPPKGNQTEFLKTLIRDYIVLTR